MDKGAKITIGDVELWTRPFGKDKAMITAVEGGAKLYLLNMHKDHPELFELLVDDSELCDQDMEGAFSVIVDPQKVQMIIIPGMGLLAFRMEAPKKETK